MSVDPGREAQSQLQCRHNLTRCISHSATFLPSMESLLLWALILERKSLTFLYWDERSKLLLLCLLHSRQKLVGLSSNYGKPQGISKSVLPEFLIYSQVFLKSIIGLLHAKSQTDGIS